MSKHFFIGLDVACRVGFVCVLFSIDAAINSLQEEYSYQYYFQLFIIGSMLSLLATVPMGHSALGKDLRGIYFYAMAWECINFLASLFVKPLYEFTFPIFLSVEHALWWVVIARLFWVAFSAQERRMLGWPRFDVFRLALGEQWDDFYLTNRQRFSGYALILCSFLLGFTVDLKFNTSLILFAPGLYVIFMVRRACAEATDQ